MKRQMLEPSDSKSVVRRFYVEAINGRDLSAVDRDLPGALPPFPPFIVRNDGGDPSRLIGPVAGLVPV